MKKLITAILLSSVCMTASAMSSKAGTSHIPYRYGYDSGYHAGKNHAYDRVAKTVVVIGVVAIASVLIYQAGKDSRWTTTEEGNIGYRF